jgi:hypothetical protein
MKELSVALCHWNGQVDSRVAGPFALTTDRASMLSMARPTVEVSAEVAWGGRDDLTCLCRSPLCLLLWGLTVFMFVVSLYIPSACILRVIFFRPCAAMPAPSLMQHTNAPAQVTHD